MARLSRRVHYYYRQSRCASTNEPEAIIGLLDHRPVVLCDYGRRDIKTHGGDRRSRSYGRACIWHITLFFAAGAIYVAAKKTDIAQLRGIGRRMPWTMAAFSIGALSMIGVPPTAGFVSKWYILGGALQAGHYVAIFTIIASTVLNAAYFLPIVYMAWFEKENASSDNNTSVIKEHGEAPFLMVLALTITAALTIGFFFFNGTVIELEKQIVPRLDL